MIAGPNGSGKSTLIDHLRGGYGVDLGDHFNADEIAKTRDGDAREVGLWAQDQVRRRRTAALAAGRDYSWETVMSHPSHIEHLREARGAGYQVRMMYVAIRDPLINRARVANRVARGGHVVPSAAIVARYRRSIAQLPMAIAVVHLARFFDNSDATAPFALLASYSEPRMRLHVQASALPPWFADTLAACERSIARTHFTIDWLDR